MKPIVTLYCIADEAGFRLLLGKGKDLDPIVQKDIQDFPDVDHSFGEKGRNHAGRGPGRTSFGHDTTSQAEIERPRLARHVVQALQAEWDTGRADQIVLAAGPKMLGALRAAMPAGLAEHIATERAKDLSDIPAHALYDHLTATSS